MSSGGGRELEEQGELDRGRELRELEEQGELKGDSQASATTAHVPRGAG